ncbi:MAG TPA: MYXO-CTERM sorting domain-containing protein [Labilithrix sp.]|nr:MYXO-CTERM sorting domain-containing protein [Labilithrix sp.]
MSSFSRVRVALVLLTLTAATATAGRARAEDTCPLGSTEKKETGFTWCEPSVCDADNQCPTGSICRPVPLCVEIGALDAGSSDAGGARLLVRQRCGANKACPQNTTCSEKSRCITLAQADKAGLTSASGAASAAAPGAAEAPKKACGCSVPGARGAGATSALLALLGVVAMGARRRARR